MEIVAGPIEALPEANLRKEIGFSYRQAIGEVLFAAIICRPGILYVIIKLSQYSTKPTKIHYIALKHIFRYLRDTAHEGLHYWRQDTNTSLPTVHCPVIIHDNHDVDIPDSKPLTHIGYVDSDWADDTKHYRSISGMCLCFAGAPFMY